MKKIIVLLVVLVIAVGLVYFASKSEEKDFAQKYIDHASFYGFGDFVKDEISDEIMHGYSHDDYRFWGVPELN